MKAWTTVLCVALLACGCGDDKRSTSVNDDTFDPTIYQLSGTVLFDGVSIVQETTASPAFAFSHAATGLPVEGATLYYEKATGRYGVNGLPATSVTIEINVHHTGDTETLPGNYSATTTVDLAATSIDDLRDYPLSVWQVIHLLAPYDNALPMTSAALPHHRAPVLFAWEALVGAARYDLVIAKAADFPHAVLEVARAASLTNTQYEASLQASDAGTHYDFSITALNADDERIGYYLTTYMGGHGTDYSFTVTD
jgi:hypothetical protein